MARTPTHTDVAFRRDPGLPGVDARFSSYSERAFRPHSHRTYSVALVETGCTTLGLRGGDHPVCAGQIALIHPDEVHVCNPEPDCGLTYRMTYVERRWFEGVACDLGAEDPSDVHFREPVVEDAEVFAAWREMHVALMEGGDSLALEFLLVTNIAGLLERYATFESADVRPESPQAVELVRQVLAARFAEKVTLDELSAVAGLSRYHLLRVFQEATGLPPHAYQTQLRIEHAMKLLADGEPISRAAVESGFSDQSHFTRVFREFNGATPSQYQGVVAPAD